MRAKPLSPLRSLTNVHEGPGKPVSALNVMATTRTGLTARGGRETSSPQAERPTRRAAATPSARVKCVRRRRWGEKAISLVLPQSTHRRWKRPQ